MNIYATILEGALSELICLILIYIASKIGAEDLVKIPLALCVVIPLLMTHISTIEYFNYIVENKANTSELLSFLQQYLFNTAMEMLKEAIAAVGAIIVATIITVLLISPIVIQVGCTGARTKYFRWLTVSYSDAGYSLEIDRQGNIYTIISVHDPHTGKAWLIVVKLNRRGNVLWSNEYYVWSHEGFLVPVYTRLYSRGSHTTELDKYGNLYILGYYRTGGGGYLDFIMKINRDGGVEWAKYISISPELSGTMVLYGLTLDSQGNIYLVGYIYPDPYVFGYGDIIVIKLNSDGEVLWSKIYGSECDEYGYAITVDGNYLYISGIIWDSPITGSTDALLLKISVNGEFIWARGWGGEIYTEQAWRFGGVATDRWHNIYLSGVTYGFGAGSREVFLAKFSKNGKLIWDRTWGGTDADDIYGITISRRGDIYLTGITRSFGDSKGDTFILRFSRNGELIGDILFGGLPYGEVGNAIQISKRYIVVAGDASSLQLSIKEVDGIVTDPDATVYNHELQTARWQITTRQTIDISVEPVTLHDTPFAAEPDTYILILTKIRG